MITIEIQWCVLLSSVSFLSLFLTLAILDRSWRFSTRSLCSPFLIPLLDHLDDNISSTNILRPLFPPIFQEFSLFSLSLSHLRNRNCGVAICHRHLSKLYKVFLWRERWKLSRLVNYQPISSNRSMDFPRNENFSLIFIFLEMVNRSSHYHWLITQSSRDNITEFCVNRWIIDNGIAQWKVTIARLTAPNFPFSLPTFLSSLLGYRRATFSHRTCHLPAPCWTAWK